MADNVDEMKMGKIWQVYIVRCADGTLYTGVACDIVRRVAEHNGKNGRGARYTKGRRPVLLSYTETHPDISEALKREASIKRLSKAKKETLVLSYENFGIANLV